MISEREQRQPQKHAFANVEFRAEPSGQKAADDKSGDSRLAAAYAISRGVEGGLCPGGKLVLADW